MKNLKISRKLFITFAIILALLVTCIFTAVSNLQMINTEIDTFINGLLENRNSANRMNTDYESLLKSVFWSTSTQDKALADNALADAESYLQSTQTELAYLKENFDNTELINEIETILDEIKPYREKVFELSAEGRNEEAVEIMEQDYIPWG